MRESYWRERSRREEREIVRRSGVRRKEIPCEEAGRNQEARAGEVWRSDSKRKSKGTR